MSATPLDDPLLRSVPTVDNYKLLPPCLVTQKLGGGGMGMVYRGFHTKLEIDVAVKVLSPMVASQDPRFVERFQREARLAARIAPENPNLIHVYDVAEAAGLHYIVMEFVHGETVRERVQRKGRLAEREAIAILAGAANGLGSAHVRDVVHRDVKPDNLMVTRDGRVKVADLGLAKATDLGGDQSLSVVMGTPKYMAPEHWTGMEHVKAPADVWALGATLYFMLAGVDPFPGASQGQTFPDLDANLPHVSAECRALLRRCVADDPSARFADARKLGEAIVAQWPDRGAKLADTEAGEGSIRATTVTPPPPETVRVARQTVLDPAEALTIAPRARAAAAAHLAANVSAARSRARLGVLVGGAVAVLVGMVWLLSLWFGGGGDAGSEAFKRGKREISQPNTLDEGIASLEEARRQNSDDAQIASTLVQAYLARARREADTDLRRALGDTQQASWLENNAAVKGLHDELLGKVQRRLADSDKVSVESPKEGAVVGREVAVEVACNDPLVDAVRIQGGDAVIIAGRATATASFASDGPNQIEVIVSGPQGTSVTQVRKVMVDTTPPELEVSSPPDGSDVGRTVTVVGSVRDASPVTLQVTVAGGAAVTVAVVDDAFRTDLRVPDATPTDASFTIELVATDGVGQRSRKSLRARLDAKLPAIMLGDFARRTRADRVEVQVRVDAVKSVKIGGQAAQARDGLWVATVPLVEGPNEIEVEATGRTDNVQRLPVKIERDSTPPRVEGLAPARAQAGSEVAITGRVSERAELTIDDQPVPLGEDLAFALTLTLADDRRAPVFLRLRDDLDNAAVVEVPVQPKIVVTARTLPADWDLEVLDQTPGTSTRYPLRVRDRKSQIVFRLVEPGEFTMGSDATLQRDEQPAHRVVITRPFYLAETETTLAQWKRVNVGNNGRTARAAGDDHPVASVSWDDVRTWLQRLSGSAGGAYRLPTEAEWEYACRAGTPTAFAFGDQLTKDAANFESDGTKVVGSSRANAWGLFDMHGNVAEWCEDVYDKDYYGMRLYQDPTGPTTSGPRVVRGGSYQSAASYCRSASRQQRKKEVPDRFVGFRVARTLPL